MAPMHTWQPLPSSQSASCASGASRAARSCSRMQGSRGSTQPKSRKQTSTKMAATPALHTHTYMHLE